MSEAKGYTAGIDPLDSKTDASDAVSGPNNRTNWVENLILQPRLLSLRPRPQRRRPPSTEPSAMARIGFHMVKGPIRCASRGERVVTPRHPAFGKLTPSLA